MLKVIGEMPIVWRSNVTKEVADDLVDKLQKMTI